MRIGRDEKGRVAVCPCERCEARRKEIEESRLPVRGPAYFAGIENLERLRKWFEPGYAEWPGDKKIRRRE